MTIYSMHWMTLTYKYKAQDLYLVKTKCHLIDKNGQSYKGESKKPKMYLLKVVYLFLHV